MTRWLLRVPHEREDDAVPLPTAGTAEPDRPQAAAQHQTHPEMGESAPCETPDHGSTLHTTPRHKFFAELMESPPHVETAEHIVIKQTDTSDIVTPIAQFPSSRTVLSEAGRQGDTERQELSVSSAGLAMPLCSDVCTFLLPEHRDVGREGSAASPAAAPDETRLAYETYGTEQWGQLAARRSEAGRSGKQSKRAPPADPVTAGAAVSAPNSEPEADPVGNMDSETELGAHLSAHLRSTSAAADADCHRSLLRNSSVRPIDSEVDIAQVLHEQSGYATLDEGPAPVSSGYQALPLHEVDSETELGLALPLTEPDRPLSAAKHRQVAAYDSETEMAQLLASLHGVDSETEMAERLRRLAVSSESEPVARPPAAPVEIDSETELGLALRLFGQGLLSSRYFAGVPPPPDQLDRPDPDIGVCSPQSQSETDVRLSGRGSASGQNQTNENTQRKVSGDRASLPLPIDDIYNASKGVTRKVINKALFLLGSDRLAPPLARTGSSAFGPTSGLGGIELEREAVVSGACDPDRVVPEISLTTSDGSFVVLFPSRAADSAAAAADYYETDEGLVLRLSRKQRQRAAVESRGFQPTEAAASLSERELCSARRLPTGPGLRRRSPSPRAHASDDGGLRVLYRAEGTELWQLVSPEGLSGLSLSPADPELAAIRWRKSSRGEDGDPEAWSAGEATSPPPPAESQSQTELRKQRPAPPAAAGANSWC